MVVWVDELSAMIGLVVWVVAALFGLAVAALLVVALHCGCWLCPSLYYSPSILFTPLCVFPSFVPLVYFQARLYLFVYFHAQVFSVPVLSVPFC